MDEIAEILNNSRTVAIVGLSANPERPSYNVGKYLKEHGYQIIPVNPGEKKILGETSFPDLARLNVYPFMLLGIKQVILDHHPTSLLFV